MTTSISHSARSFDPDAGGARRPHGLALRALWALVLLLLLPGLAVGPVFDDWFHGIDAHTADSGLARFFNLYDFFGSDEVDLGRKIGVLPWWTDDRLSLRFFRPLSSLLLGIDHVLLDGGGFLSHVHALLWFALVLYTSRRLFRLMFTEADARWMTPLYGILGCHALPLGFAAARHSLVTAAFAFAYFECAIRWNAAPSWRLRLLASASFSCALLAGESAISIVPIALAYLAFESGVRRALRALAPDFALLALFALAYSAAGFGASHSGAYLQPGSAAFFAALPARWTALAGGLMSGFPPDLWIIGVEGPLVVAGVVSLAATGLALAVLVPRLDAVAARRLGALLLGGLCALAPLAGGVPGGRLLVIPCIGTAALVALAARQAADSFRAARGRALVLGGWVVLFGIGVNPLVRVGPALDMARVARELPRAARSIGEQCADKVALAVGTPDSNVAYVSILLLSMTQRPSAFHIVSMAAAPHELMQAGQGRYELTVERDFMGLPWARIYRDEPIRPGASHALQGLELDVLEARGSSIRLALEPTEPACWLTLERGELVALTPPTSAGPLRWTPTPRPM